MAALLRRRWQRRARIADDTRFLLVAADPDVLPEDLAAHGIVRRVHDADAPPDSPALLEQAADELRLQMDGERTPDRRWHAVMALTNGTRFVVTPGATTEVAYAAPGTSEWQPAPEQVATEIAVRLVSTVDEQDPSLRVARRALYSGLRDGMAAQSDLFTAGPGDTDEWFAAITANKARPTVRIEHAVLGMGRLDSSVSDVDLVVDEAYDPALLRRWNSVAVQAALYAPVTRMHEALRGYDPPSEHYPIAGFAMDDGTVLLLGLGAQPVAYAGTPTKAAGFVLSRLSQDRTEPLTRAFDRAFDRRDVELSGLRAGMTDAVRQVWGEARLGRWERDVVTAPSPLDRFTEQAAAGRRRGAGDYRRQLWRRLGWFMTGIVPVECGPGAGALVTDGIQALTTGSGGTTGEVVTHAIVTVGTPLVVIAGLVAHELPDRPGFSARLRAGDYHAFDTAQRATRAATR